jgi:hypothetical protein
MDNVQNYDSYINIPRHKPLNLIRRIAPRHIAEDINLRSYHPERLKFHGVMELRVQYNERYCRLLKRILPNTEDC